MFMDNFTIPIKTIVENGLNINEYIVLFNISNNYSISHLIDTPIDTLLSLEKKGFIKLTSDNKITVRESGLKLFRKDNDIFVEWLEEYPTSVVTKYGRKRALSPAKADTILAKRLYVKWKNIFKNNVEEQKKAVQVLRMQVENMRKSHDLEYMVEATRWLNEGFHEKYEYLLDEGSSPIDYRAEDYL